MKSALLQEQCKALKLGSVSRIHTQIAFENREQFLTDLFAEELKIREENRNRRRLKRAGFPQTKTLEEFSWESIVLPPQTTREHLTELSFIDAKESLICMGGVGTGKTHLVIALGLKAALSGKGGSTESIRTAFMHRNLADWEEGERHAIPYTRAQVERFSPRSRAILEIRGRRDLEILEKIYSNSVLLGDDGPGAWQIQYSTEFHMTNDSELFPPRAPEATK
ncbi:MAG: ATP-binding protein [Clostridia bacterium]|nr:ATP-binding protein [Clostridia bacterium]